MYLIALGRYDEAEERACEALALAREQQQDVLVAWTLQHLGAIAALRPQVSTESATNAYGRAAPILGFVDARLEAIGSAKMYIYEQGYDRAVAALREAIGACRPRTDRCSLPHDRNRSTTRNGDTFPVVRFASWNRTRS
jgi:tetratricopeptide (TPR) repeat protein